MVSPCPQRLRAPCAIALWVFIVTLVVYVATAARAVYWGDSTEFVAVATTMGVAHPPGYPLYTLLGALAVRIPIGTPFFRMSLLSALFASAAAAMAALTVWAATSGRRSGSRGRAASGRSTWSEMPRIAGSILAGTALAFGGTFWSQAVVPEVYTLSVFLGLAALFLFVVWSRSHRTAGSGSHDDTEAGPGLPVPLLRDRPVVLLGMVIGLGLANHLTIVFLGVPIAVGLLAARRRPSPGAVLAGLCLFALGLSLYAYLPLRAVHDPAVLWTPVDSWETFLAHMTGEQYAPLMFAAPRVEVAHKVRAFLAGLPSEMTWIGVILAAFGLATLLRSRRALGGVMLAWCVLVVAHASVYRIPDIASYYAPVYAALSVAAGVGLEALASAAASSATSSRAAWRRSMRRLGWLAPAVALAVPISLAVSNWPANDLSEVRGGKVYLERVLDSLDPGSLVVTMSDHILFPLWYARHVEGVREDLVVIGASEHAPHLSHLYPEVRFPSEGELCSVFESSPAGVGGSALAEVPVANYLPLLFSLNAGERPLYTDAAIALRLFADRSIPRGILVEISPSPLDSLPERRRAAHDAFWQTVLHEAGSGEGYDRRTAEFYAKTLAEHGSLMLERGETEWAIDALERACALAPEVPLCHSNLGIAYERSGRRSDALDQFEVAIELNPGLAAPHHNIAVAARRSGELDRAERELRVAIALEPDNPYYRMEYGGLLEQRSEFDRAEKMYKSAALMSGDDWGASLAYGDFLRRMRRYSDAVAAYRRVEELRPETEGALRGLGRCYWALDDREQALEVTRRLVELQPHNPAPRFDLAVMLYRSGRARQAVEHLDDVIRILPNMWEARALKASILGELGRYWEARSLFEEALEYGADGPAFWDTWISMERSLGENGMEDEVRARSQDDGGGAPSRAPVAD